MIHEPAGEQGPEPPGGTKPWEEHWRGEEGVCGNRLIATRT